MVGAAEIHRRVTTGTTPSIDRWHAAAMPSLSRLTRPLHGPHPALPAALDRCSERWWRLPPRVRVLAIVATVCCLLALDQYRVVRMRQQWGGPARRALVAVEDAHVGDHPRLRTVALPPAMVPPDAPQTVADGARLTLALPEGAVLTRAHVSPRGPAVGLDPGLRVVPLPVPPGLEIGAGARVDVWILTEGPDRSRRVAQGRAVLAVSTADGDDPVALVGLAAGEVAATVAGLAAGDVLLTQAPP